MTRTMNLRREMMAERLGRRQRPEDGSLRRRGNAERCLAPLLIAVILAPSRRHFPAQLTDSDME
jgi:hypothetical protein